MRSKSKGNEHFRLVERILCFPNVYFDFDLLKMFPNVFSSQITYQTFRKEMPFQMLESESLGCQSVQIFQLSPHFSLCTRTLHECESFVQWQLLGDVREWQGFAHGMVLVARLVLAVSVEAGPKRTFTQCPSGLPCHAEGFDLKYLSSLQQLCVSRDSWRYLWSSTVLLNSSLLLTTSTFLKRQVLPPVLSSMTQKFTQCIDGGFSAHVACRCII